jgi:hypothetical protein
MDEAPYYAQAFSPLPGRCFLFISRASEGGGPIHCLEPPERGRYFYLSRPPILPVQPLPPSGERLKGRQSASVCVAKLRSAARPGRAVRCSTHTQRPSPGRRGIAPSTRRGGERDRRAGQARARDRPIGHGRCRAGRHRPAAVLTSTNGLTQRPRRSWRGLLSP